MAMSGQIRAGRSRRFDGFTLIELMITLVVIAVLTTLAIAAYDFATVKTRRNLATACLLENAQLMQRFHTVGVAGVALTYVGAPALVGGCVTSLNGIYTFAFNPVTTVNTYRIVATPVGRQLAKDGLCGTLSVNQNGVKTESGTGTLDQCW